MKHSQRGFSLVELVVVMGIVAIIAAVTVPLGLNYYRAQVLDETYYELRSTLRRAHSQAVSVKNDSAFGVKIMSENFVLFQGETYAGRVAIYDEVFDVPTVVSISGADEIIFNVLSGTTGSAVTISLELQGSEEAATISVSTNGIIE